ncbi:hypothetical protein ARMGADRAFT_1101166 [Armillaria gallica]|uniref:Uncharacterized protein n=1 Tax=Armillaria gallica TaxID=47427 RepID=A0A2H3CWG0_ARMGA|nr:hypothetical protein ARMGADRAFT_1101166 [Armillaria gallica]
MSSEPKSKETVALPTLSNSKHPENPEDTLAMNYILHSIPSHQKANYNTSIQAVLILSLNHSQFNQPSVALPRSQGRYMNPQKTKLSYTSTPERESRYECPATHVRVVPSTRCRHPPLLAKPHPMPSRTQWMQECVKNIGVQLRIDRLLYICYVVVGEIGVILNRDGHGST